MTDTNRMTAAIYHEWLNENMVMTDIFSIESMKKLVLSMLVGKNYRVVTESVTKEQLFKTYSWLVMVYEDSKRRHGKEWRTGLFEDLKNTDSREEKDLALWLLGLTRKTAANNSVRKEDYPDYLTNMIKHYDEFLTPLSDDERDNVWLLLMAGAATLKVRGSQKSSIGKTLEKVLVRTMLTLLGFVENVTFWVNIERDQEVAREVDVEVESKRGRIRIEVGLIESGNQEVIEDKIQRVGRNGVVIFDRVGAKTRIYQSAAAHGVKLIQIRDNNPLAVLRDHLEPLVSITLNNIHTSTDDLREMLDGLPDDVYTRHDSLKLL